MIIIKPLTIMAVKPTPPAPTIPVVLMPDGKYWTSVDLAIDDGQGEVFVYNDVTVDDYYNFGTQYYYSHTAAKRVASNIPGYHLPTVDEWISLFNSVSSHNYEVSTKLRSTYGWYGNGTDDYGFSVLPVGNENNAYTGSLSDLEMLGNRTSYWCYDNNAEDERHDCVRLQTWGSEIGNEYSLPVYPFCFKVRLIKD